MIGDYRGGGDVDEMYTEVLGHVMSFLSGLVTLDSCDNETVKVLSVSCVTLYCCVL